MTRLNRLWHTVRFLRAEQILFRLFYRFGRALVERRALAPLPALQRRVWPKPWHAPLVMPAARLADGVFRFLGETGEIRGAQDWNAPHKAKLWLYNLHYLDDLNAEGADDRQEQLTQLVARWTQDNPPLQGNGWEPYPLSLRLVNLVKWYARQADVPENMLDSLARQAQALATQLERHILANHLFANGKALTFVGAFFSGGVGERWLRKGLHVLDREVPEQFLPDGGHFELSPMYHAALLWDLCDLINLADRTGVSELKVRADAWRQVLVRGLGWLQSMSHPDGEIAFFNDAALGVAPSPKAVATYAQLLGIPSVSWQPEPGLNFRHLADSGYIVVDIAPGCRALLDVAQVGPSYQPGHAHADTLSFELSLHGHRVLVNSGTSVYGEGKERLRQRGTAAHNTVEIDGKDSSEVWAGFRVARRARPLGLSLNRDASVLMVRCAHDGYRWLHGAPRHTRIWRFTQQRMSVTDRIEGKFRTAVARFYLHPDVRIGTDYSLILPTGDTVRWSVQGAQSQIVASTWHPTFGVRTNNHCLEMEFKANEITTDFCWERNAYPFPNG